MKILFKILKANSGEDIYFRNLNSELIKKGVQTKIYYYHQYFQFFPPLLYFYDLIMNRQVNTDIIHSSADYGWVFKRKNIPLVVTIHHSVFDPNFQKHTSIWQKIFHTFIVKPSLKLTLKVADRKIAVSGYTKKSICDLFKCSNIEVIHNRIDTNLFKPMNIKKNDNRFHLLFTGNLITRKGVDLLPKIMNILGDRFVLYYTSGLRTENKFGLNSNMVSLGKLSQADLIKEYNKCDVLLFPTRLEGFGYSAAEAMACGKPVITTNCSSLPEIVTNQENGFLCKVDDVNDFVSKIKLLSTNKNLIDRLSKNNRKKVIDLFSINAWAGQFIKIYESI